MLTGALIQVFVLDFKRGHKGVVTAFAHVADKVIPLLLSVLPIALTGVKDRERGNDKAVKEAAFSGAFRQRS